jgi:hypothetical protein
MSENQSKRLKRFALSGCLAVLCLSGGMVLSRDLILQGKEVPGLGRKIGYFTYLDEDRSTALAVDVELARMRKSEKYLPLGIWVANKDTSTLKIDRQSLLLVDEADKTYPMSGNKEISASYSKYALDAKYYARKVFKEGDPMTAFASFLKIPCSFFPHSYKASGIHDVLIDSVDLPQRSFIEDLVYFPNPKPGAAGQTLRLRIQEPELEEPLEVGFVVD